jgi:hypothetical protein
VIYGWKTLAVARRELSVVSDCCTLGRLEEYRVAFISVSEPFVDFTSPFGKLMLSVLGAFAEWYLNNLREETRKGKRQRAKSGGWNGTLSWGYGTPKRLRDDLVALGDRFKAGELDEAEYSRQAGLLEDAIERFGDAYETQAVPDPMDASGVLMAYTLYATGTYSDAKVAQALNDAGYRTRGQFGRNLFSKDTVFWMLKNRFYLGETSYSGGGQKKSKVDREWIAGDHEPIISQELYDRCQQVRAERRTSHGNTSQARPVRTYLLSQRLVCQHCGTNYRGHFVRGQRYYYEPRRAGVHCEAEVRSVLAETVEAQAASAALDVLAKLPPDWKREIINRVQHAQRDTNAEKLEAERARLEQQLERVRRLYVAGDITETAYEEFKTDIAGRMPARPVSVRRQVYRIEQIAERLNSFEGVWEVGTPKQRQQLLASLFSVWYIDGRSVVASEPTDVLWNIIRFSTDRPDGSDGIRTRDLRLDRPAC